MRKLSLALLLSAAACTPVQEAVDNTARQAARGVVAETLATRFPQVSRELITPFTDCVINNASAAEIRTFAKAGVVGVEEETAETVRSVLARPETLQCLGSQAINTGIL